MTELFWRIWTAVVLVSLAVLALFVFLAALQFENINSALTSDRLAVLADRTAEPFRAPLKIGLSLSTVRNAQALLERARQTDDRILAVHVFDEAGHIVHSTAVPSPAEISPQAMAAHLQPKNGRWQTRTEAGFISGVNLNDNAGDPAGGVLIEYPVTGHLTQVRAMAAELGFDSLGALAAIAVIGALLLRFSLRRMFHRFEGIEAAIAEFERGAWRSAAGVPDPEKDTHSQAGLLRQLLPEAEARYRAIGQQLAGLDPEVEREQ